MDEIIDFERFGEDVLILIWLKFRIPLQKVPDPQREANDYISPGVIRKVARAVNLNQILCRKFFNELFEAELVRLKSLLESGENLLVFVIVVIEYVFRKCEKGKTYDVFTKVIQSLTVPAEVVIFLESKGLRTYIKNMPSFWNQFFLCRLSEEFEEGGGLKMLEEKCDEISNVAHCLNSFMSKHCILYTGEDLFEKYRNFAANWKQPVLDCSRVTLKMTELKDHAGRSWERRLTFDLLSDNEWFTDEEAQNPVKSKTFEKFYCDWSLEDKRIQEHSKIKKKWLASLTTSGEQDMSDSESLSDSSGTPYVTNITSKRSLQEKVDRELINKNSKVFHSSSKKIPVTEKNSTVSVQVEPSAKTDVFEKGKYILPAKDGGQIQENENSLSDSIGRSTEKQSPKGSEAHKEESLQKRENRPKLVEREYRNENDSVSAKGRFPEKKDCSENEKCKSSKGAKKKKKKKQKTPIKNSLRSEEETLLVEDNLTEKEMLPDDGKLQAEKRLKNEKENKKLETENSSVPKKGPMKRIKKQDKSTEQQASPVIEEKKLSYLFPEEYADILKYSFEIEIYLGYLCCYFSGRMSDSAEPVDKVPDTNRTSSGFGQSLEKKKPFPKIPDSPTAAERQPLNEQSSVTEIELGTDLYYRCAFRSFWDRFAEDIFSTTCKCFKVPLTIYKNTDNGMIEYLHPDFLEVTVATLFFTQILKRRFLYQIFDSSMKSDGAFLDTPDKMGRVIYGAISMVSCTLENGPEHSNFAKVIFSLTVPIELILFLASKGTVAHTEYFPVIWRVFFASELLEEFQATGGMANFYKECFLESKENPHLHEFIEEKCLLYTRENLYDLYVQWLKDREKNSRCDTISAPMVVNRPAQQETDNSNMEGLIQTSTSRKATQIKKKKKRKR